MNEPVLQFLKKHLQEKKDVRLLNIYKGVPISYDATVVDVNNLFARLKCNKYQIPSIFLENGAYIQGEDTEETIHAQLYQLDLERSEVVFTNLVPAGQGIGQRSQVRVEPEDSIWAAIKLKNSLSEVMAKVTDLSMGGLGIYLERYYFHPQLFRPGTELTLSFDLPLVLRPVTSSSNSSNMSRSETNDLTNRFNRDQIRGINSSGLGASKEPLQERVIGLPGSGSRISCKARVIHYRPELYNNRYRIGLRLQDSEGSRQLISQFVARRQADLIREFRLMYDAIVQKMAGQS
jgi:hypothetical protein